MNGVVYSTRVPGDQPGQQQIIMEIWIEQIGICINETNGAFKSAAPRSAINHFGTFNISDQICQTVKEFVEKKLTFEQINQKIFGALKSRLVTKKSQHNRIV
ncbi:MAG TPA: hypothetical protein VMV68_06040 [Spirochaetia bacterium]|nr:hypothetical protein [Spirochaetia bacterium]